MNRLVYVIYALVVTSVATGINSTTGSTGSSPRAWGSGTGFSTGSGNSWGGSHK